MKTRGTLAAWLENPGARTHVPITDHAPRVGIHDSSAIEHVRTYLWDLSDYRVDTVQAGVIWLVPRRVSGGDGVTVHEAYQAATLADIAWQTELVRVYGRRAGDARYGARGTATDKMAALHAEFARKTCEWRNHPETSCAKGCDCTVDHGFRPRAHHEPSRYPLAHTQETTK